MYNDDMMDEGDGGGGFGLGVDSTATPENEEEGEGNELDTLDNINPTIDFSQVTNQEFPHRLSAN